MHRMLHNNQLSKGGSSAVQTAACAATATAYLRAIAVAWLVPLSVEVGASSIGAQVAPAVHKHPTTCRVETPTYTPTK